MIRFKAKRIILISRSEDVSSLSNYNGNLVILVSSDIENPDEFKRVSFSICKTLCKFVILVGTYSEILKDYLLDELVKNDDLRIPFFVYQDMEEAVLYAIDGSLPVDSDYDLAFLTISEGVLAQENLRKFISLLNKSD